MATKSQPNSTTIEDALTEEKLIATAQQLTVLPTADKFKQLVEDELWSTLVQERHRDQEAVSLSELPEESRNLIGYLDKEEGVLPWWFEQFDWQFSYNGEVVLDTADDPLSDLEELSRGSPTLSVPSFRDDNRIYATLEGFEKISTYLQKHLGLDERKTEANTSLSQALKRFIEKSNGDSIDFESAGILRLSKDANWIESTGLLETWVSTLVELIPPNDTTMTALMLVNCGLDKKYITGVSEVTGVLNRTLKDSSWNDDKHRANAFAKILRWEQVLDIRLQESQYDEITTLEESFYRHWRDNTISKRDETDELFEKAKEHSQNFTDDREYAGFLLALPIQRFGSSNYLSFITVLRSSSHYGSPIRDDERRSEIIHRLLTDNSHSEDE